MTLAAIVAVAASLVASCSGGDSSGDVTAATAKTNAPDATSEESGAAPPGFTGATTIQGEPFDASTVAGRDAVAWFWAPWCMICRAEAPEVADAAERYAEDITFVGVAGRGEIDAMRQFVADTGVDGFTHVADLDGSIWTAYGVYAQPAFAFIDDDGQFEVVGGAMDREELTAKLDELIAS